MQPYESDLLSLQPQLPIATIMCRLNSPQIFTVHLSSTVQFEEVSLPWYIFLECIYAIARAMSVAKENLKPQFSGMSSFCNTSLRLPLGQYSLIKDILSGSLKVAPMNLHKLGWSNVLYWAFSIIPCAISNQQEYIGLPYVHNFLSYCVVDDKIIPWYLLYGYNATPTANQD